MAGAFSHSSSLRIIYFFFVILCGQALFPLTATGMSLSEILSRDQSSIVYIKPDYYDDKTQTVRSGSVGTGFIISPKGYFLSSAHVLKDWLLQSDEQKVRHPITVRIGSRSSSEGIEARVIVTDTGTDIALLRLLDPSRKYNAVPICFEGKLTPGSPIFAMGFPGTEDISSARGTFSNDNNVYDYFVGDIGLSPGMSGGPIYNEQGLAIGVAEGSGGGANQSTGLIIPIKWVRSLLQDRADVASKCADTTMTNLSFLPDEDQFCGRLNTVISAAKTGIRNLLPKGQPINSGPGAKISLPKSRWCAVNSVPGLGGGSGYDYYSCLVADGIADEDDRTQRFNAYTKLIQRCLGSQWSMGEIDKSDGNLDVRYDISDVTTKVQLRSTKSNSGFDMIIHVNEK
jgi:Trypsin-like peptidase domain